MICPDEKCTGCGACVSVCVKKAIVLKEDLYGTLRPAVDSEKCVHCELCKTVCPNNQDLSFFKVKEVYASYSLDKSVYKKAASGGVASELYKIAIKNNWFSMGTCFDRHIGVFYKEIQEISDLDWACSSKYVYSNMLTAFKSYYEHLSKDENALFIGLPCQCAALDSYLNMKNKKLTAKLFLVNIICHGVPNWKLLDEHLVFIEKKYAKSVSKIFFRSKAIDESHRGSNSYDYHLRCISDDSQEFYICDMHKKEAYGNAFLSNLIFRENCYSCRYASPERFCDLTIGDYDGLGCDVKYSSSVKQVSCVLVYSENGNILVDKLNESCYLENRPISEPFKYNGQLNNPSIPHKNREKFKEEYLLTKKFELAVKKSLIKEMYFSFNFAAKAKQFIKNKFVFIYTIYTRLKKIGGQK